MGLFSTLCASLMTVSLCVSLNVEVSTTIRAVVDVAVFNVVDGPAAAELCNNPFSSTECKVDVVLRDANSEVLERVPAFFRHSPEPSFTARWRPPPGMSGVLSCTAELNGIFIRFLSRVTVTPPPADGSATGVIKVSPNKQYFVDSATNELFFPVGPNLAWPDDPGATVPFYNRTLPLLAAAKVNYVRVWLGPSNVNSTFSDIQLQTQLGTVDETHAEHVDWVLTQCEALGIRALLAIESYNSLCTNTKAYCSWDSSVYKAHLDQPTDFWTSDTCISGFKDYTRYVVARYGASSSVFSWQIFNEMDGALGGSSQEATWFLGNITQYIRDIDPHGHLITNSYAGSNGNPADDMLDTIDYTTTHAYGSGDLGKTLQHYAVIKSGYGKPTYSGEFGRGSDPLIPRLVLHNGMWGTVASLGAASGACWWWDNLFSDGLLDEFTAISNFMSQPLGLHLKNWTLVWSQGVPQDARAFTQAATDWSTVIGYVYSVHHVFGAPEPYPVVPPFNMTVLGCNSSTASYSLQWFNTSSGLPVGETTEAACAEGCLNFTTPAFSTDLAYILLF